MVIGHPELVAAIASEIALSGPIPFVRFMDLALYHPQFGYYMRHPDDGSPRIGWSGDFYTSADVHPILGRAVAKLVPVSPRRPTAAERKAVLDAVRAAGRAAASRRPGAARSEDSLHDGEGLSR